MSNDAQVFESVTSVILVESTRTSCTALRSATLTVSVPVESCRTNERKRIAEASDPKQTLACAFTDDVTAEKVATAASTLRMEARVGIRMVGGIVFSEHR